MNHGQPIRYYIAFTLVICDFLPFALLHYITFFPFLKMKNEIFFYKSKKGFCHPERSEGSRYI